MGRLLEGSKAERFQFIKQESESWSVRYLCRYLNVSHQGYYQWLNRIPSMKDSLNDDLLKRIQKIFIHHKGRYGSPRVYAELRRQGLLVNHKRVARLMKISGLVGTAGRIYRRKPLPNNQCIKVPNRQREEGLPESKDQQWAGDVTYLKLNGQWRYLAVILDLYSRKVVGWSLSSTRNAKLTLSALDNALRDRKSKDVRLFHSDRGSEYGAYAYQQRLSEYGIQPSMNRPKYMNDNVYVESFFQTLKTECFKGMKFGSDIELKSQLSWYLDKYYNQERLHSSLGFNTPDEYERLGV